MHEHHIKLSEDQTSKNNFFGRYWEDRLFKDMRALNVMYPNYITRVREYIPEIISFIEVIIKNR